MLVIARLGWLCWRGLLPGVLAAMCSTALADDALHVDFDRALRTNVRHGLVNYPGISQNRGFQGYLGRVASVDAAEIGTAQARLAFWINAYNALAIKGILDGGSPSSWFGRIGYFKNTTYDVGGRNISLYDLEHKILRPLGEPRIHFAINCASKSCPVLRAEAYRSVDLESQLDDAARVFVNDPSRNRFDQKEKVAHLSKIFDWFDEDFGDGEQAVLKYLARYVADPALATELRSGKWRVEFLDYDWSLNGQPPDG